MYELVSLIDSSGVFCSLHGSWIFVWTDDISILFNRGPGNSAGHCILKAAALSPAKELRSSGLVLEADTP